MIKTYHLKTIAFWYFEKTAPDSFTHLILLLQELAEAMLKREHPIYFMPKVNLLEGVTNDEETMDLFEKVNQLSTNCAAITKTVQKLSKITLNTAFQDVIRDFVLVWESTKQAENSDVQLSEKSEIKYKYLPTIAAKFCLFFTNASRLSLIQDKTLTSTLRHDLGKIHYDKCLSCIVNIIDAIVNELKLGNVTNTCITYGVSFTFENKLYNNKHKKL